MKDSLEKLKFKMSLYPYKILAQTIVKQQPIYVFDISNQVDCEKLADACRQTKEIHKNNKKIKSKELDIVVRSWTSDYTPSANASDPFLNLFSIVEKHMNNIDKKHNYYVDHFWCVVYEPNDSAIPHSHGEANFASVFYPHVPEESSPICFNYGESNSEEECINVKTGNLIIFPGELIHFVPKSLHSGERMSISMNLFKKNKNNII